MRFHNGAYSVGPAARSIRSGSSQCGPRRLALGVPVEGGGRLLLARRSRGPEAVASESLCCVWVESERAVVLSSESSLTGFASLEMAVWASRLLSREGPV